MTLEVENLRPVLSPRLARVTSAIENLTSNGGPGFLILSGPGQDYLQTAGGDGAYIVEWREHAGPQFRHFAAGYPLQPAAQWVVVPGNGTSLTAKSNEKLMYDDVVFLAVAFLERRARPQDYAWRDMTDMFS